MQAKFKEYSNKNRYSVMLFGLMILLLMFFSVTKGETLWSLGTWNGIFIQFPEYGIMTLGVMFCFIIGNIDMSFVALGDFACIMAVRYMAGHVTEDMATGQVVGVILIALLIAIAIGVIGGIINGVLVAYLNIPPVMATIAMQLVWLGLSTALTKGYAVTGVPALYTEIGHTMLFGFLPVPLLIFLIIFLFSLFLLKFTTYGKRLYMTGTNLKAAKFSAINTKAMIISTFILCDVIACIGCMIMVSTMNSAKADYGTSYVMRVILILVLAGVLPDGGMGKIFNVLLSIVAIQIIASGVNMFSQLNSYYASLIWGGLLIIVLILSTKMNGTGIKLFKLKKQKM
ncbi:MAG: sugar transporter permease [Herbinix sp.]|jgi:simple sugar transport system permease protein|nr:sugar transporter permease [Herbinix sp.]